MKLKRSSKELIKEYIQEILKDNNKSQIVEYIVDDMSSMGGAYATQSDLYNAFVKPFSDFFYTAVGKTKEVMRRGMTVLQTAFVSLMTTLVPFLTDSYDKMFAQEKADMQKIRSEYQSYYDATAKALGSGDAKMLAFIAFPGATLTGKFVKNSPKVAKGILSVATGGLTDKYLGGSSPRGKSKEPRDIFDSYVRAYKNLLSEEDETRKSEENSLASKIGSKMFINAVMDRSPTLTAAQKDAYKLHQRMLGERIKPIFEILDAKSIEELSKILKSPIEQPDLKELDPKQKMSAQNAENKFLEGVKKTAAKAAMQAIQNYVKPVRDEFGNDHPFVKDYDKVLAEIELGESESLNQIKKQLGLSK